MNGGSAPHRNIVPYLRKYGHHPLTGEVGLVSE